MDKSKLTLKNIKKASKDIKVIEATETVLIAIAHHQTMREFVEPIQRKILEKHQFQDDDHTGQIITEPKETFLLSEKDFWIYHDELQERYKEEGIYIDGRKCPLLVAENMEIQAKKALVDVMEKYTGIGDDDLLKLEDFRKYIELSLNFMTQFTRKRKLKEEIETA